MDVVEVNVDRGEIGSVGVADRDRVGRGDGRGPVGLNPGQVDDRSAVPRRVERSVGHVINHVVVKMMPRSIDDQT